MPPFKRIIFMGTPEFALPSLDALIKAGHEVAAVVTQPDRPVGRGKAVVPPPVKLGAEAAGLTVLQPLKLREDGFIQDLCQLRPDFIVVVAYGKLLPEAILEIPPFGCVNLHASLLPKYRGAAPINWAVINNEKETGVTTMLMDRGMDTGAVFLEEKTAIGKDETAEDLSKRLSLAGAGLLVRTVGLVAEGKIRARAQDEGGRSLAPMLKKEDGRIDWGRSAEEIHSLVRGVYPWPGAFTSLSNDGRILKIHRGRVGRQAGAVSSNASPGVVAEAGKDFIAIRCGKGESLYEILELQPENRRRMGVAEFLAGSRVAKGARFA